MDECRGGWNEARQSGRLPRLGGFTSTPGLNEDKSHKLQERIWRGFQAHGGRVRKTVTFP